MLCDLVIHLTEAVESKEIERGASLDEDVWEEFSMASISVEKLIRSLVSAASLHVLVEDPTTLEGTFRNA